MDFCRPKPRVIPQPVVEGDFTAGGDGTEFSDPAPAGGPREAGCAGGEAAPRLHAETGGVQDRIRRAEQAAEREREQAKQQRVRTAISVGATLLGALLGRKAVSTSTLGRATTAARAGSRVLKETQDVARAVETVEHLKLKMAELEAQFGVEVRAIQLTLQPEEEPLERVVVRPKRTGIIIRVVTLCWAPHWQMRTGGLQPASA